MQKIALDRLGLWFSESLDEYKLGFSNLLPWGALVFGLIVAQQIIAFPVNILAQITPAIGIIVGVIVGLSGIVVQAVSQVILLSVGLARWHGREATFEDVKQDVPTQIQGVLGMLTVTVLMVIVVAIILIPGAGMIVAGIHSQATPLIVLGVLLCLILGLPVFIVVQTLTYFTLPLIIDKRLDFWSAVMQSVDCVRRDLVGLAIFSFLFNLCFGLVGGCTCGLGVVFLGPYFGLLQMRAYRDYFGLEADAVAPRLGVKLVPTVKPMAYPWQAQQGSTPPPTAYPGYVPPVSSTPPPPPEEAAAEPPPGAIRTETGQWQVPPRTPDISDEDDQFPPPPPPSL